MRKSQSLVGISLDALTLCCLSAIMKYHGLKMEEINTTIKDLWQKTYQGTGELREALHAGTGLTTCFARH